LKIRIKFRIGTVLYRKGSGIRLGNRPSVH
jgi:hypothetical protein